MTSNPNAFAASLRRLREAKGVSQSDLARAVGVKPQAINRLESGRSLPSLTTLVKLADVLGCRLDTLAGRDKR